MTITNDNGTWHAVQKLLPNIVCVGFDADRKTAMLNCYHLVEERRKANANALKD